MKWIKWATLSACVAVLTACPSTNLPNVPHIAGSWKNLGSLNQGNLVASYDANSLRRNGDLAYLRDRKIVVNPEVERYAGTLRYKVAVSDWEFHCKNKNFRLTAVQFLDEKGKLLLQERYINQPIPPMPIASGTIAEKQFAVVCR